MITIVMPVDADIDSRYLLPDATQEHVGASAICYLAHVSLIKKAQFTGDVRKFVLLLIQVKLFRLIALCQLQGEYCGYPHFHQFPASLTGHGAAPCRTGTEPGATRQ